MENLYVSVTSVAAITIICSFAAQVIKLTPLDNKWLPAICGGLGGGLGPIAMAVLPDFPAEDPLTAVAVGIVSGLAATGVNQIYKQLKRN